MRRRGEQPSHKGINSISFGVLSSEEIKQSSVLKVWAPLSFNQYGRPMPGGPYDCAMGPTDDKGALCTTCYRSSFFCPGHMGHVELPVPVVNPVFRRQLSNILRICCVKCHKTRIPDFAKYMLLARLKLLDMGYSTAAIDAEQAVMNPDPNLKDNEAIAIWARDQLEKYVANVIKKGGSEKGTPTKNYEALKRLFIDSTLHSVSQGSKTCFHCKASVKRYILYRCRFITNISKVEVAQKFSSTEKQTEETVKGKGVTVTARADELRDHMRGIWANEQEIAQALFSMLKRDDMEFPTDLFFLDTLSVAPPNTRPPNFVNGTIVEHPQTYALKQVLQDVIIINNIAKVMRGGSEDPLQSDERAVINGLRGDTNEEKFSAAWDTLQSSVDHLLDKDINKTAQSQLCLGIKQVIEKKEGIFRMHMMGKRVNFAARSVITPDPNLNVDEIGIPEVFAMKLTYPTPVTPWNVEELRKLVLNGPCVHPGAVMIQNEDGSTTLIKNNDLQQRAALAKRLLTPPGRARFYTGPKIVHRHLCNGDVLLLNRQPTLHRPSIMAHKARVLKGEKTIRLHYANCSSYNADFDGDEMNAHFPQNELARSEGYNLVNVCHQYLVPKSGTPLSGLIQDHVVSGVRLTTRGRFFTREDYQQLVYQGLSNIPGKLRLLPPCILKPQCLWSGKQVLSTVLLNVIPRDKAPISINDSAKISAKAWENMTPREWKAGGTPLAGPNDMTEAEVVIRGGELLCGVLDKKHYGATPYGLVHCIYELYGGEYSAKLLSAFAKLFTAFLQTEGFTLGVADIIVLKKADKKRSAFIKQARQLGDDVVREALELPPETSPEELRTQMKSMFSKDAEKYQATLDRKFKSALDKVTNEINKSCLPAGLVNKFPSNNLQLMVQSGAKGSTVNTMQISCLLGQIELEGKRPSLMISGKSLPSFIAFDTSPRAGGFIEGRFMTGIRPQEFFFHCMAGREGLIDTAVKTSRSGYLQRCLVKHLEGLVVGYDQTVRDSDGSVIQYYYGEDGMDVCKAQFFTQEQLPVLCNNSSILASGKDIPKLLQASDQEELAAAKKELKKWKKKHANDATRCGGFLQFCQEMAENMDDTEVTLNKKTGRSNVTEATVKAWQELDHKSRKRFDKSSKRCPDPVCSKFRLDQAFGSLTEKLENLIEQHVSQGEREEELRELLQYKSMLSQAAPGEPVGILAAQSVGEPSTQMTLNTFHFAGRGDMNVTLGIPRLRELFMMASKNLSTPSMDIPFLPHISETKAERLRIRLTKVTLGDVLEKISVTERVDIGSYRQYTYKIRFSFLPRSNYKHKYPVKPKNILKFVELQYFYILETAMKKSMQLKRSLISSSEDKKSNRKKGLDDEGEDEEDENPTAKPIQIGGGEANESSDEEEQAEDEDATMARTRSRHTENREYEDPEEEEVEQESDVENDEGVDDGAQTEANYSGGAPEKDVRLTKDELLDDPAYSDFSSRVQHVKMSNKFIQSYEYDFENELWCEVIIGISLDIKKVDMSSILRSTAEKAVIWQIPKINKAFIYRNSDQELMLKVDGINIPEMLKHHTFLNLNRLYTNHVHEFAEFYGIEAACRVLVKEVQDVFQVYGITVDPRHLLLIADYMTFEGLYLALNRSGMANNASPLQKITFETALAFLRNAVLDGTKDYIQSPSSCIITGRPCRVGTGVFDLRLQMNV